MSFQVRDVVDAMAGTATAPTVLRVDGGASAMGLLLQLLADQTRLPVVRPRSVETTALGAATLAGLAEGMWSSLDELSGLWTEDAAFAPAAPRDEVEVAHQAWLRAVDRSRPAGLPRADGRSKRLSRWQPSSAISAMIEIHWRSRSRSRVGSGPTIRTRSDWIRWAAATTSSRSHRIGRRAHGLAGHGVERLGLGRATVRAEDPGGVGVQDGGEVGGQALPHQRGQPIEQGRR